MKWVCSVVGFSSAKSTKLIIVVKMRITARANAWRKVEGQVGDRRISRKRKGNMLSSCELLRRT